MLQNKEKETEKKKKKNWWSPELHQNWVSALTSRPMHSLTHSLAPESVNRCDDVTDKLIANYVAVTQTRGERLSFRTVRRRRERVAIITLSAVKSLITQFVIHRECVSRRVLLILRLKSSSLAHTIT